MSCICLGAANAQRLCKDLKHRGLVSNHLESVFAVKLNNGFLFVAFSHILNALKDFPALIIGSHLSHPEPTIPRLAIEVYRTKTATMLTTRSKATTTASDNTGVRMFCTTAGAKTSLEEVPIHPLPDQVNPDGSDPEETDSDLDDEDDVPMADVEGGDGTSDGEAESDSSDDDEFMPRKGASRRAKGTRSQSTLRLPVAPKRKRLGYRSDLAGAVGANALLPACEIGAVELLTFFPNHTQWPEVGLRLYGNGWNTLNVAKMQLHPRGRLNKAKGDKRITALRHQVINNGKEFFNDLSFKPSTHGHVMTPVTSYDASQYAPKAGFASALEAATLIDIAQGVVNWPMGQDRGIVTQVIEYAHQNGLAQYTTVHVPQLAQQFGFMAPNEASTTRWDQNARVRAERIVDQAGAYR